MNKLEQLQNVFNRAFENCPPINADSTKDSVPQWDSFGHLVLILELEKEFNLKLTTEQIEKMKSVADILKLI
jgi:acyl carrier protein